MTKKEAKEYLTVGNHKLSDSIASFSLPATKEICGVICNGCYAHKAQNQYPAVLPSRAKKLELSKQDDFVDKMTKAAETLKPKFIRLQDSGEFYSQEYVDKVYEIAKRLPNQDFYCYTKRLKDFDFTKLKALDNFVVINSLFNNKINYGKKEDRSPGMFQCPDYKGSVERLAQPTGQLCGSLCNYCMTKSAQETGVWFVQH